MPNSRDRINETVYRFAAELTSILEDAMAESLVTALQASRGGRGASTPRASSGAGRRGGSAAWPSRRLGRAVSEADVLKEVKREGGRGVEALAKSMRTTSGSLKKPLVALIEKKEIKRSGQARGT